MIEEYLSYLKTKEDNINLRKNIVNTYIKNIILYKDKVVILFNFIKSQAVDDKGIDYEFIEKQFQQPETALTITKSSYIQETSPPIETHTKQPLGFVSYFYLWDCFGFVLNFERPKIENTSHLNWIHQQRDEHGNWIKNKVD